MNVITKHRLVILMLSVLILWEILPANAMQVSVEMETIVQVNTLPFPVDNYIFVL